MADWIDALADLPQQAVNDAIREWIRGETKRPTPAAIRQRAKARIEPKKPPKPDEDEWPFAPSVVGAEELERRREQAARLAEAFPVLKR